MPDGIGIYNPQYRLQLFFAICFVKGSKKAKGSVRYFSKREEIHMYELISVGERTYYINSPAKMGLFLLDEGHVCLIDSGNDKDAGKKVNKILEEHHWKLALIINTHSNADHIGGNRFLQEKTGCRILSTGLENAFIRYPHMEPSLIYGGYPCRELRGKFMIAPVSEPSGTVDDGLPDGLSYFRLPGHFLNMIGVRTSDDVCFIADCLSSKTVLEKYHIPFIYDVKAYLETLTIVEQMEAKWFVPAHAEATNDIGALTALNRNKVEEVANQILLFCRTPIAFEELLKNLFDHYQLTMNFEQYALVGSTVRSYLSWLYDDGKLSAEFKENRLLWKMI